MNQEFFILLGLLLGIIGYITLNLGKGIQKYAIERFKSDDRFKIKSKNSGTWLLGTSFTLIFFIVQWIALLFAPVNLIAPLDGLGLIVLFTFSYFVLKEETKKVEIFGIFLIIIGTIFVTLFNSNPSEIESKNLNLFFLFILFTSIISIEIFLILFSKLNNYKGAGLIFGIAAGTFMAFSTISKRITAIPDVIIKITFIIIVLIFSLIQLILSNIGYTKANANVVVPCFTSSSIILAVLIGYLCLNERIVFIQIIGIIQIICGIILLSVFKKNK